MKEPRSPNDGRTRAVTRLAPRIETAIVSIVPFAWLGGYAVIFVDFVRGMIPWQTIVCVSVLILPAGAALTALIYLQWHHIRKAAYHLSPTELQYWDWRGRRHAVPLETIQSLRSTMLPVPSIIIDYREDGAHQTLAIRFSHVWDDRFGANLRKKIRDWAQLTNRRETGFWREEEEFTR